MLFTLLALLVRSSVASWTLIVDCGSTGNRLYAYRMDGNEVKVLRGGKSKPGLHTMYQDKNLSAAVDQMAELLRSGARLVQGYIDPSKILIRCTGGVRDEMIFDEQSQMLDELFIGLQSRGILLQDRKQIDIISGYDEAAYAFHAANYLEKKIDSNLNSVDELVGALDMGGSSTQITFEHADGSGKKLFAQSYAGLGAQAIRSRLAISEDMIQAKRNPCAHSGDGIGSGDFDACILLIRRFLLDNDKTRLNQCQTATRANKRKACAVQPHRYQVPQPKADTRFLAMCNFFYAADAIRAFSPDPLEGWPTPALSELEDKARTFCALPWNQVLNDFTGIHRFTSDALLPSRCFDAALVLVILRDVYALDHDSKPRVTFLLETQTGLEVEWTLGYFLAFSSNRNTCLHNDQEPGLCSSTSTSITADNASVGDFREDEDQRILLSPAQHNAATLLTPTAVSATSISV